MQGIVSNVQSRMKKNHTVFQIVIHQIQMKRTKAIGKNQIFCSKLPDYRVSFECYSLFHVPKTDTCFEYLRRTNTKSLTIKRVDTKYFWSITKLFFFLLHLVSELYISLTFEMFNTRKSKPI